MDYDLELFRTEVLEFPQHAKNAEYFALRVSEELAGPYYCDTDRGVEGPLWEPYHVYQIAFEPHVGGGWVEVYADEDEARELGLDPLRVCAGDAAELSKVLNLLEDF